MAAVDGDGLMFTHLRVASGYSFHYGASHPSALVRRAAQLGMDALACTDRDGLYGAVRFAKACLNTGISPIIGVDLALGEQAPRRGPTAAKGGQLREENLPRLVVMATSRRGWGTLCDVVTQAHLHGERSRPVVDLEMLAGACAGRDVLIFLGADSPLGEMLARSDLPAACREAARWQDIFGAQLIIAPTNHHSGGKAVASAYHAAGMLEVAKRCRILPAFTNMVRFATRELAPTVDILDATRRRMALSLRTIDRKNAEGYLKSDEQMRSAITEAAHLAGLDPEVICHHTQAIAQRCLLDPVADIGLGEVRLPEFETLGTTAQAAPAVLKQRCEAGIVARYGSPHQEITRRLDEELAVISQLGFESYFLTVTHIVDLIKGMGIRCAARGSGAGSLVNYLLGISGVDPIEHGLMMERFLSPRRQALPDIDLDVESERRSEIYEKILAVFGGQRVSCMTMVETYRVRHAVRDVGAALGLPPAEIDAMAKAFPRIRAGQVRAALEELPELQSTGMQAPRFAHLFSLVESLDALPRHIALHPCGMIVSDSSLGQRTPVEASHGGFPMSQFDKDDVEDLGLLKLDILGVRMQSAMAHALSEIHRTDAPGPAPDLDALAPFDDAQVYEMIAHRATVGCFQIESPGQRELVGKFGPASFSDIIIDISLFRPGPVKSDMVSPFLAVRQGWESARYLDPRFRPILEQTCGVVVFHEQVIELIAAVTGCSLAEADEARRALGDRDGAQKVQQWMWPRALEQGYRHEVVEEFWEVLQAFASFGFCKAHAAAFALPTYQSAWLKRYYPAHFIAGILTHDPGMYPKRMLLEEARRMGIAILGLDINRSQLSYQVEASDTQGHHGLAEDHIPEFRQGMPYAPQWGIRLSLSDVAGISEQEASRIVTGAPYRCLTDFLTRAHPSEPIARRLIILGALDSLYGICLQNGIAAANRVTRRDLLLSLTDLYRQQRAHERLTHRSGSRYRHRRRHSSHEDPGVLARVQVDSQAAAPVAVQETLDLETAELDVVPTGLPEMSVTEQLEAELEILGLDASQHIMERSIPFLTELGAVSASQLLRCRHRSEVLVAGVKVSTQTPPVRSARRVIFVTLDDSTGPVDVAFFDSVQSSYAATVFNSWMLLVRGVIRRTGPRGISVRATGAWDLTWLQQFWQDQRRAGVASAAAVAAVGEIIESSSRPDSQSKHSAPGRRRLWHSSPGSSGR